MAPVPTDALTLPIQITMFFRVTCPHLALNMLLVVRMRLYVMLLISLRRRVARPRSTTTVF